MSAKKSIDNAKKLGAIAHAKGLSRVPAHDPALKNLLITLPRKDGQFSSETVPVLDAWLSGWDSANLGRKKTTVPKKGIPTSPTRQEMENIVWATTHKDYKGTLDGQRSILYLEPGRGTALGILSKLPEKILQEKYADASKVFYRDRFMLYQIYSARGSKIEKIDEVSGRDAANKLVRKLTKENPGVSYYHQADEDYR